MLNVLFNMCWIGALKIGMFSDKRVLGVFGTCDKLKFNVIFISFFEGEVGGGSINSVLTLQRILHLKNKT